MNIEIKIADYSNEQQGQDIIHLLNAYALDPMGGAEPLSAYTQNNLITTLAKQPNVFSILVYVDDKPAGLANCIEGFSTFKCSPLINIHDLVVLQEFRGLGLSQKLLQKVDETALNKGCCKVTLEVLEGNHAAKHAYIKHGFSGYELDPEKGSAMFWQKILT
ncbi:GNAT family N-acetyltransferase [Paraglaciecola aquimarina]|uniref:GNAT family N-acetyltransferase n=1 Tax=Paraglaciecola algarum TaxID=3050085 RepID=A0ABS9D7Y2_9ALTE|nr:GNAT family N-acetyltransferase [Paraglaciecola sp. G1-23]MCF2947919.1 GNAT family N-acetyltransferase [Paraglaciecola sp. G1-23]